MTPKRKEDLVDGAEVAVWLSKSASRGSRYGAGNNAAPRAAGSGCWVRATVSRWHEHIHLVLTDERTIKLPPLRFIQVGDVDLRATDPRA